MFFQAENTEKLFLAGTPPQTLLGELMRQKRLDLAPRLILVPPQYKFLDSGTSLCMLKYFCVCGNSAYTKREI